MEIDENILESIRTSDINNSLEKYTNLANTGNSSAFFILGYLYEFGGKNFIPNDSKAIFWYKKSYDVLGDYESLAALARVFLYMRKDYKKAYKLYKRLENRNIPVVHLSLGKIYESGELGKVDYEKAKYHYKKSYELGNLFGGLYYTGLFFMPESTNSLLVGLGAFFKHQWLRVKILVISITNSTSWRIKQM